MQRKHVVHHSIMLTLLISSLIDIYLQQRELSLFLSTIANAAWMYGANG